MPKKEQTVIDGSILSQARSEGYRKGAGTAGQVSHDELQHLLEVHRRETVRDLRGYVVFQMAVGFALGVMATQIAHLLQ